MTQRADAASATLEHAIAAIEMRLEALGAALRERDAAAIETSALALQRALASAVHRFNHSARSLIGVAPQLRHRLAAVSAQVAAQRESLVRATAAIERAVDVLMPSADVPSPYAATGGNARSPRTGSLTA
jgi:hypothetical protein